MSDELRVMSGWRSSVSLKRAVWKLQTALLCLFFMIVCICNASTNSLLERQSLITYHSSLITIFDHSDWNKLLKKHVNDKGFVDYAGFKKDQTALTAYLQNLSKNAPNEKTWSKDEQLAFWINAYNAYTIQLILDHYPVKSIKDIGSTIKIPFVSTGWDIKFIKIGGKKMDLNHIEHGIIRKQFDEPRIHFALVCAAKSCPKLRNEAYNGTNLEEALDQQAKDFLNDITKNKISKNKVELSKIFSWYGGDFTKKMPLTNWINKYSTTKITPNTSIDYLDYNWELNGK